MSSLSQMLANSSVHGVPQIVSKKSCISARLSWTCILIIAFFAVGYQMFNLSQVLQSYPATLDVIVNHGTMKILTVWH